MMAHSEWFYDWLQGFLHGVMVAGLFFLIFAHIML